MAIIELIFCVVSILNLELLLIPILLILVIAGAVTLRCSSDISGKLYINLVGAGISFTLLFNFFLQYYIWQKSLQPQAPILHLSIIWLVLIGLRMNKAYAKCFYDKKYSKRTGKY